MKKYLHTTYILGAVAIVLGFAPVHANAATVYLQSDQTNITVGDTAIVSVKIDAQGQSLNTVDGSIALASGGSDVTVQEFSLANSAFGLWPRTPSLSTDGSSITFVGGVPGGFNIEGATLFKIVLTAKKAGTVTITPRDLAVYANDGSGTKVSVTAKSLTIHISTHVSGTPVNDVWDSVIASDNTPPEPFIIVLGQDKTLYDGKQFAYFSAVDSQSGISYYEVSENGAPAVRSGSVYVIQDQSDNSKLEVVAFDKAGNKRIATYGGNTENSGLAWTIIILIVIAGVILYRRSKKHKNNA